ncbi:MAG: glycerol-3-phosphate 1-O-acyltransferase PlsY [Pseudomonadota bacterium]
MDFILTILIFYLIPFLIGYLIGSIPFGLVLTKVAGTQDIRTIGSGNIGATNVLRTGRKDLAIATLLLDSGKGAFAVFIFISVAYLTVSAGEEPRVPNSSMLWGGLGALIGHCFPVWLKFKGGKGVATTLGTLLAVQWPLGLIACALWLVSALTFRISSLSALIAVGFTPLIAHYMFDDSNLSGFCAAVTTLVYLKHRENIKRLFAGEEPKINLKKKAAPDA